MANSSSGESVLSRIVRIVGSFDDGKPGMGVAAIARRAGIPLATTHRLVAGLVDVGWLEHQANGEGRIGLRLWELVNRNSAVLGLRPTCGATTTASMPPSCAGTWPASGRPVMPH